MFTRHELLLYDSPIRPANNRRCKCMLEVGRHTLTVNMFCVWPECQSLPAGDNCQTNKKETNYMV